VNALWLGVSRKISGRRLRTHHPFASEAAPLRVILRLDVLVRDRPRRPKQSTAAGTADEPRGTGPSGCSPIVQIMHDRQARLEPPLLRFSSPSAHSGRAALSGVADPRTIPLRRFRRPTRAFADASERRPPMRFFAAADDSRSRLFAADVREGLFPFDAPRKRSGPMGTIVPSSSAIDARRACPHALVDHPTTSSGAGSRLPPGTGHAPMRLFARRSATRQLGLSRPGRAIESSLRLTRRRSWGSTPFAGLFPLAAGPASLPRLTHVSFADCAAPIYFRRGDRPPDGGQRN